MNIHLNKKQKNSLLLLFVFLVYPFSALPFIFIEIYHNNRFAYRLLAVFIGYIGLLIPPYGDLYRYTQDYLYYKALDFPSFLHEISLRMDYLLSFILWGLGHLNIPCDISRFLYVWIGSDLIFSIYYDLIVNQAPPASKKMVFCLFCILLMYVSFIGLVYRYLFSAHLFAYGVYKLYCHKKKGWLFIILSIFNHFSFIVFTVALVLVRIFPIKGHKGVAVLCILGIFLFSINFMSDLIKILPLDTDILNYLLSYTDGIWSGEFLEEHSVRYRIYLLLKRLGVISLYILYIILFKRNRWSGWLNILLIIIFLFVFSVTIRLRFESVISLFLIFYIFNEIMQRKRLGFTVKRLIRPMIYVGIILSLTTIYANRRVYALSVIHKLTYSSSYMILTTSYDENWINKHIAADGGFD